MATSSTKKSKPKSDRIGVARVPRLAVSSTSKSGDTGVAGIESVNIGIIKLEAPFEVIKPFSVQAERLGNAVVASFKLANINASGDTWTEAVTNLKDLIISVFDLLASHPPERLGRGPRLQLATLRSFIRKSGTDAH